MKNIIEWDKKKKSQEKITMVTCYDFTSAKILATSPIDAVLVGDSIAMTMMGESTTLGCENQWIKWATLAVRRGAPEKFIVSDLAFLTTTKNKSESMSVVEQLFKAGAQAVKVEGVASNKEFIQTCISSGVPVMAHTGLMPQHTHLVGGYKVQGREQEQSEFIKEEALIAQELGCFSIVLECVPTELGKQVTGALSIPTIGIGAGPGTDGQILVWQDLLGLTPDFKAKFVKAFSGGAHLFKEALDQYCDEVQKGIFPSKDESYSS